MDQFGLLVLFVNLEQIQSTIEKLFELWCQDTYIIIIGLTRYAHRSNNVMDVMEITDHFFIGSEVYVMRWNPNLYLINGHIILKNPNDILFY